MKSSRSKRKSRRLVTYAIVSLVLVVAGFGIYKLVSRDSNKDTSTVNLEPATEEEKQQAEETKNEIVSNQQETDKNGNPVQATTPTTPDGKKQVAVIISSASSSSVTSYVTGVNEEGGTCTALFTQGSQSVTRTSSGFSNVSYTQCAPIDPDLPSGGKWSVVVSYNSSTAAGSSQAQAF